MHLHDGSDNMLSQRKQEFYLGKGLGKDFMKVFRNNQSCGLDGILLAEV